jgi:hypothetical protein
MIYLALIHMLNSQKMNIKMVKINHIALMPIKKNAIAISSYLRRITLVNLCKQNPTISTLRSRSKSRSIMLKRTRYRILWISWRIM